MRKVIDEQYATIVSTSTRFNSKTSNVELTESVRDRLMVGASVCCVESADGYIYNESISERVLEGSMRRGEGWVFEPWW
jgi:hypothetical protein